MPLVPSHLRKLPCRLAPLALASVIAAAMAGAHAEPPLVLKPSLELAPAPRGDAASTRPIILRADEMQARPDLDAVAEGHVELRRAGTVIRADRLTYDNADDRVLARGGVEIARDGNTYRGPELQIRLQRFEGYFLSPTYEFAQLGAGGRAERIDFIDSSRLNARNTIYTSCPRDGSGVPDWLLTADRVRMDFETNEGVAEGAVLRFLGAPIIALPVLSFPLSDERKSGWLPPNVALDSKSGLDLGVPYYWNIAPNRDATITPRTLTRRGVALDLEFRYLEPNDKGRVSLDWLPADRVAGRSRLAWQLDHDGDIVGTGSGAGLRYRAHVLRVSDDAYWKDFPRAVPSITPRLLPTDLQADRDFATRFGALHLYSRVQRWKVLQTADPSAAILSPYQRSPQIGLRLQPELAGGLRASVETELNHFTRPDDSASATLPTGWRAHALAQLSRPFGNAGWWLTPKMQLNAASYRLDQAPSSGLRDGSRLIPTFSVDAGMVFERDSRWFGVARRQTLEPRLLYVNTPFRDQTRLPNFDAADRTFNLLSLFSENAFTGIDRVSDSHQVTAGLTTRLIDPATGAESQRLTLGQRFRLRDQRITPDGQVLTQRVSDLLLEGATQLPGNWALEGSVQYNPDGQRTVGSVISARYLPAPFHAFSAGYRFARGLSEQLELGWQWPVYRGTAKPVGAANGCGGALYAVGRVNYSLKDSRITDSIAGLEYDAGCWIARVVGERLSTGRSEATTRLLIQLELTGLSRLGSNPLQVLKDNIPGYRLLREPRSAPGLSSDGNP